MKDSRKIIIRLLTVYFLVATGTMLGGCSVWRGTVDAVTWAPRKLWSVTGDKWFGVHNEQQTEMGPRRKPSGNPQAGGAVPGYPAAPQRNMNGGMPPGGYPPAYPQQGGMPQQGNPYANGGYPAASPYGMPPQPQGMGMPQPPYNGANDAVGAGYPPMPPMPPMPQGMPQAQDMSEGFRPSDSSFDGSDMDVGADAAFARGGGGGAPKKKGWSMPFFSGKYKMESRYEPLSAEFTVAASGAEQADEYIKSNNSVLQDTPWKNKSGQGQIAGEEDKEKSKRSSSMFPIDQYAPKPTATIQKIAGKEPSTYPKLGRVPEKPQNLNNVDAAADELDKMIKDAEDAEAKKNNIHKLPQSNPTEGQPDKTIETPKIVPEEVKPLAPESRVNDTSFLVKRREDVQAEASIKQEAEKNTVSVAPGALKSDAKLIKNITQNDARVVNEGKPEPRKGFFASLHDKIFTPSPKKIFRKSEPPVMASRTVNSEETTLINNGPVAQPPISEAISSLNPETSLGNNYDAYAGSLLPKSRYADRRKASEN